MASSSKPTAVHFALVFFVMATLILALVCYLTGKEYAKSFADAKQASDDAAAAQRELSNALSDIAALKELTGYQQAEVGVGSPAPQGSMRQAMLADLQALGREQQQPSPQNPTVAATLQSMRSALDAANTQVASLQQAVQDTESRLRQEQTAHRNNSDQLRTSQQDSEAQLQKLVSERDEMLSEKDREIARWRDEYRRTLVEKEQIADELQRVRKTKDQEIFELASIVDTLKQRIDEIEKVSFEVADGEIVRVDNTTRMVWINVGSLQNLRPQVTFSVYTQSHLGIGRGVEDIKAKIEVTEIVGPQLAAARILQEDLDRPIADGDPIYSPLWSAGLKEYFAFVGVMDLNGDGKDDRKLLHDIVENAGAGVELEVTPDGERHPPEGKLTVETKFLVVGKMEDPTEFPGFDDKQDEIKKTLAELQALEDEARRQGIRIVKLSDFLAYIGYKPQQRLYIPGQDREFRLKYGARSTATNDSLGSSRESTGQTSNLYSGDRNSRQRFGN